MLPREINLRLIQMGLLRRICLKKAGYPEGLYAGQQHTLEYIRRHEGCTQTEVAEALRVSAASVALSTKRLQKTGLIRKETNEENLRCNRLYLTEKGNGLMECGRLAFDRTDAKMMEGFTQEQMQTLAELLDKMIENLSDGQAVGCDFFAMRDLEQQAGLHCNK
ncbi:MAG: MarR family transcriptional regulator [Clostridia bacterium]|nr:MarR family transcriptional regulator [Clostridia bacterium]